MIDTLDEREVITSIKQRANPDGAVPNVKIQWSERLEITIESTFATTRLQQRVTKGPGSRAAGVATPTASHSRPREGQVGTIQFSRC
jgi:hypothetical protein